MGLQLGSKSSELKALPRWGPGPQQPRRAAAKIGPRGGSRPKTPWVDVGHNPASWVAA